jgi:RecB family endonuclease NucS
LPPGYEANEFMVVGRWADIVTFEPNIVTIIEAKLEPSPEAVGQLQLYGNMFKQSPRFAQYASAQVNLVLLTSRVDTHVQELCEQQGIRFEVFRPEWIVFWEKQRFRI